MLSAAGKALTSSQYSKHLHSQRSEQLLCKQSNIIVHNKKLKLQRRMAVMYDYSLWRLLWPGHQGLIPSWYSFNSQFQKTVCWVAQSCPTLCGPMDCSLPGSSVHGILQPRIVEWVAMPSSRGSSWLRGQTQVSCIAGRFSTVWATGEALRKSLDTWSTKVGWDPV